MVSGFGIQGVAVGDSDLKRCRVWIFVMLVMGSEFILPPASVVAPSNNYPPVMTAQNFQVCVCPDVMLGFLVSA